MIALNSSSKEVIDSMNESKRIIETEIKPLKKLVNYLSNNTSIDDIDDFTQLKYLKELGKSASKALEDAY